MRRAIDDTAELRRLVERGGKLSKAEVYRVLALAPSLLAEVERLRVELADLRDAHTYPEQVASAARTMRAEIKRLRAEVERLEAELHPPMPELDADVTDEQVEAQLRSVGIDPAELERRSRPFLALVKLNVDLQGEVERLRAFEREGNMLIEAAHDSWAKAEVLRARVAELEKALGGLDAAVAESAPLAWAAAGDQAEAHAWEQRTASIREQAARALEKDKNE